jgi:hypothetical protein
MWNYIICKIKKGEKKMYYYGDKKINKWEIVGVFWMIIVGSLLHFTYEWSNNLTFVGVISSINESVWEHLKLGYWSLIFFSLIEYPAINRYVNSFLLGKALGIVVLEATIIGVFYSYTAIIKRSILWVDISSYVLGAIFCQWISSSMIKKKFSRTSETIGLIIFIVLGFAFIVFTFYPPKLPIFMDPITKTYGIYKLK